MGTQTEVFLYLGRQSKVHFFFHRTRGDGRAIAEMCGQVYNMLIAETMVRQDDNLVVFAAGGAEPEQVIPVQVSHARMAVIHFPAGGLEGALQRLMGADRTGQSMMVIEGSADFSKPYLLYQIPAPAAGNIQKILRQMGSQPCPLGPLQHIVSLKPIDYL